MPSNEPNLQAEKGILEVGREDKPFMLAGGAVIAPCRLAYETYGQLNAGHSNAVLLFHALSGSQHAAGIERAGCNQFWTEDCHRGWWDAFVGPGKALDTNKYFVICANFVGGCYGSTGPASVCPETARPYGNRFPWPHIGDIVDSQVKLLDHLAIPRLLAVVGPSLGGFCAMDLALRYAERVAGVIVLATALRPSVLRKTLNFEQIFAIQEDAAFNGGDYYEGPLPRRGLTLARMIGHKTYVSLGVIESRARSEIIQPQDMLPTYRLQHRLESYLLHQGVRFADRFDANSYLRIIGASQSFDLMRSVDRGEASLADCQGQQWLVFSIDSDVCFYPEEQAEIASVLGANGVDIQHITVHSDKGHDAFLLEPALFTPHIVFKLAGLRT